MLKLFNSVTLDDSLKELYRNKEGKDVLINSIILRLDNEECLFSLLHGHDRLLHTSRQIEALSIPNLKLQFSLVKYAFITGALQSDWNVKQNLGWICVILLKHFKITRLLLFGDACKLNMAKHEVLLTKF